MRLEYAVFILLIFVVLVLVGTWCCEYTKKRRASKKAIQLPILTDREKRRKVNELLEPMGFAYDGKQDLFYSRMDSWQRKYGYGKIYDEGAAHFNMVIDCEPIYFEYDEKRWLIEFWKGQYGITTGSEVGVYYLPQKTVEEDIFLPRLVYQCVEDEDTLRIKTVLWKKGKMVIYRRGYHWWLTGFLLGEFSRPRDLEMDIEITLKDETMRDAFLEGLSQAGYQKQELSVVGNTVWISFSKPHSSQPLSRRGFYAFVKQLQNRYHCRLYRKATKGYVHVYDKILALKTGAPKLYHSLGRLGKGRFFQEEE